MFHFKGEQSDRNKFRPKNHVLMGTKIGLAHNKIYQVLTRAQKDQGTSFSYYPFDPPSNKLSQVMEIIMLEYL